MSTLVVFLLVFFGSLIIGWAIATLTGLISEQVALHNPILPILAGFFLSAVILMNTEFSKSWLILSCIGGVMGGLGWGCYGLVIATRPVTEKEIQEQLKEIHRRES